MSYFVTIAYSVQAMYNARGNYLQRFHNFVSLTE